MKRLLFVVILAGLLAGCGAWEKFNTIPPEWNTHENLEGRTDCKEVADECFDYLADKKPMAAVGFSGNKGHVQVYTDFWGTRMFCYFDNEQISLSTKHHFSEPYKSFTREKFNEIRNDHMGWIMREE